MSTYGLSTPQWHALRLIVHRLRCEAAQEEFDPVDIGQTWEPNPDSIVATADDGKVPITHSDLMYAVVMTAWSLIVSMAEARELDPGQVVAEFALEVATVEP